VARPRSSGESQAVSSTKPVRNETRRIRGAMDLTPLIPIVAIVAIAAVKIARLRATRPDAPSADVTAQLESLESAVQGLQRELAETQERLDFAERLLSKAREER